MSTVHSRKLRGIVNARQTAGKQPAKGSNETSATTTPTMGPSKLRPKPMKTKKKTQKKQQAQPQESNDEPEQSGVDEVDEDETDPLWISTPVMDLVNESLTEAWVIHPSHQTCIVFDVVNPVTGGKGSFTQWVHCESVVSFEAICPVITQQVCGGFF